MYAVCFIDLKEQLKCVLSPYQKGGTDVDGTLPDLSTVQSEYEGHRTIFCISVPTTMEEV